MKICSNFMKLCNKIEKALVETHFMLPKYDSAYLKSGNHSIVTFSQSDMLLIKLHSRFNKSKLRN